MSSQDASFEAKYILIDWAVKESALSIKESKDTISITKIDSIHFELEATTFSKISDHEYGQLAFRIIEDSISEPLYFEKNNDEKSFLIPVIDNLTKKTWWVEGEEWSKSNKRWQSEIFRSAGGIKLRSGSYFCLIKIGSCSFTYEQLSGYLQDFKNDLWYLVLHETSYISAPVQEKTTKVLDESSIDYFNSFIDFAIKIIEKPKSELREIQELKNLKQVKPAPRTFMEIATTGYKKQHTSRAYKSSYNVPENQYVLFIINRLLNLIINLDKVTNYISLYLRERVKNQEERIANFSDIIKINRQAVVSDYKDLREKAVKEKNIIDKAINEQSISNTTLNLHDVCYRLTLGTNLDYDKRLDFFLKDGLEKLGSDAYYILSFDQGFQGGLVSFNTYKIIAKISFEITRLNNKEVHKLTFCYIDSIEIIRSTADEKYRELERKAKLLKENNWERMITASEKRDQEQEIYEIKTDIVTVSNRMSKIKGISDKLSPTLKKLIDIQKRFSTLNIKPNSLFPSSMSFIQNPNYQGVHKLYKEIQSLSGIDEQLFIGLEEAESIGILNISLIYERWCLLQIIKILIDKFQFLPEKNWKNKLVNQIINVVPSKVRNVKLTFENKNTSRRIALWYEKELPIDSGKSVPRRADFVLDLVSYCNPENETSKRIVLDAKFYENIQEKGGIDSVINELYNFKNYSDSSRNQVVILHPSPKSVPEIKTPQEWAENSFLGETKMFDWDNEYPNHRYGAVFLSPLENKGKYLDGLQMCIGMFLQYGIEGNQLKDEDYNEWIKSQTLPSITKQIGLNPIPKEKVFCLLCGSNDQEFNVKETGYKLGLSWVLVCNNCKHKTLYNYCINKDCRSRLIKHGPYWTYHATQSLQPFNIKCPTCGEIVVPMESNE